MIRTVIYLFFCFSKGATGHSRRDLELLSRYVCFYLYRQDSCWSVQFCLSSWSLYLSMQLFRLERRWCCSQPFHFALIVAERAGANSQSRHAYDGPVDQIGDSPALLPYNLQPDLVDIHSRPNFHPQPCNIAYTNILHTPRITPPRWQRRRRNLHVRPSTCERYNVAIRRSGPSSTRQAMSCFTNT